MSLTLHCCEFHDGGTALVDALEDRTSSFGSLKVDGLTTFSFNNLKRLLQLEELGLPCFQDKLAVLSFSAKVRRLDIKIPAKTLSNLDLDSLNIAARQLSIRILHKLRTDFRTQSVLSFFGRVTDLGHFTELKVRIWFDHNDFAVPDSVVQAVLRAALANVNLEIFDLSSDTQDYYNDMAWDPHVETLLEGLAEHKALCTVKLGVRDGAFGPDLCHLRRLLSRNRKIRVTNAQGLLYTDGASIDNLYALTRLYRGSVGLIGKPLSERSSLVATALMESASGDLQRCALLLSDHAHTV